MTRKNHNLIQGIAERNQKYYKDIISLMPGHVYWKDKNGVFLGCNLNQAKDAGFNSPDEMVGKTDKDMPWAIQTDYLREIDLRVMQSGKVVTLEELFELPDGTKKMYLSSKLPLYDENDQVSGILGISFDITDRKKLEEDLVKAKNQAEAANQAKTEFLENMRHDIRTPLSGIVGFAEIIKNESTSPLISEYADNLVAASHTLLEFLNEILEAIKVLSGELPTAKQKFSFEDMVQKIIQLMTPRALEKHLKINLEYDDLIPKYVIGDPKKIQRILLELLANALKFTNNGHITISINLARKTDHDLIIKCIIEDTGIGIPEDKQEEIFLRFKKLSPSYRGIYKGAGLGLSIVKQFVDDLKGELYCQSQIDKGSTFTCLLQLQEALLEDNSGATAIDDDFLKLPQGFVIKSKIKKDVGHHVGKSRVLIVEDQPIAAKVAEAIITGLDCSVDIANNGEKALTLMQENVYDLIFMDVGLPDIDGYTLTKKIRNIEWQLDLHVPIIALTAHIDSENKQKCIESGMDAVLSKPLTQNTARDIINAFVVNRKPKIKSASIDNEDSLFNLNGQIIDLNEGMATMNVNKSVALEMIRLLLESFDEDLVQLTEAKTNGQWDIIKNFTHKYRGSTAYTGTPRLNQACIFLEDYLASGSKELCDKLYQQLLDEVKNVKKVHKSLQESK